ncbi:unnamed protein product [Acanthoscelides obtectus]|uniref:Uncharacterized protein n=1 Tax=Acanthoscelides obtectus TaxID=200917 RepID=A0A9P0JPY6_ACAOB|nr:unnamed protein product [Acanthoscelides obtectus]CAK1668194.1 hypothetical protein AOBTE_LOCUS26273 [Acanthoscelides obtectus]
MDAKEEEKSLRWYAELELEEENVDHELGEGSGGYGSQNDNLKSGNSDSDETETESEIGNYNPDLADGINQSTTISWNEVDGSSLKQFVFDDNASKINIPGNLRSMDIFRLIVDPTILEIIVLETNKNAKRYKHKWIDVSAQEI